jgi:RNA polymerase sigma factor (sigma-70 family)
VENLFGTDYTGDLDDAELVERAQSGEKAALEALITRHQDWIYNISLRMVGNPDDARDITQEILIKIMTRLSGFERRSSFRTWTYRIVVNHVLTMRRRLWERFFYSFERQSELIERLQESDAAEETLMLEETKSGCMSGMLLCLERPQRIALILGSLFGVGSDLGAALMETTAENYRQIVSRARKRLANFMNDKCGLMNESNPCRCFKKIKGAIKAGLVDPEENRFNLPYVRRVREFVEENSALVDSALEMKLQNILRDRPMYTSPDLGRVIGIMMRRGPFRRIIEFN